MAEDAPKELGRTGLYERAVNWVTALVKPYLHRTSERFVNKAVDKYAKEKPHFARMIEFEVRRRGDGAGLTQDVAEPLVWIGVKTALAIAVEVIMKPFKSGKDLKWKWIGHAAALGIMLQQAVELFRLLPRYKAGLQGSLEMAKDRWRSIEETGIDPFNNQQSPREINKREVVTETSSITPSANFAKTVPSKVITPTAILENKARPTTENVLS